MKLNYIAPCQYWDGWPSSDGKTINLVIPLSVGMSTSESWVVNGYTTCCTSPISVVSQHKPVSGWQPQNMRSESPHGSLWLVKDFTFFYYYYYTLNH